MAKKIDLTGRRFGRLVVVEDVGKRSKGKQIIWECKCDCGNTTSVRADQLKSGQTKSCGCLNIEKTKQRARLFKKDLTGQRFGRLTVIKDTDKRSQKNVVWECKCDCGKTVSVKSTHLIEGAIISCGCYNKEIINEHMEKVLVENTNLDRLTQKVRKDNSSGVKGVYKNKRSGKWVAEIKFQGKKHWLGSYDVLDEASKARKEAEEKYFHPILEKYDRLKED